MPRINPKCKIINVSDKTWVNSLINLRVGKVLLIMHEIQKS